MCSTSNTVKSQIQAQGLSTFSRTYVWGSLTIGGWHKFIQEHENSNLQTSDPSGDPLRSHQIWDNFSSSNPYKLKML